MDKRVLVACECSQVVCTAFRSAGDIAYSCDIQPCYGGHPEWHIECDVTQVMYDNWDLVIAHPPCTYLTKSGAYLWHNGKHKLCDVWKARNFFMMFTRLDVPTCIENPIPMKFINLPRPTQWICPSQFGHKYTKKTGLWLYDLPPLLPMRAAPVITQQWMTHAAGNSKARSRFFEYVAEAMAIQWG